MWNQGLSSRQLSTCLTLSIGLTICPKKMTRITLNWQCDGNNKIADLPILLSSRNPGAQDTARGCRRLGSPWHRALTPGSRGTEPAACWWRCLAPYRIHCPQPVSRWFSHRIPGSWTGYPQSELLWGPLNTQCRFSAGDWHRCHCRSPLRYLSQICKL